MPRLDCAGCHYAAWPTLLGLRCLHFVICRGCIGHVRLEIRLVQAGGGGDRAARVAFRKKMKLRLPNELSLSPGKLTLLNLIGLQWKFGYLQSFGSFNFSESYFWGNLSTKVLTKYVYFWDCFLVALPLKGPLRNLNGALD